jgi:RecA/RadA recombinase
MAKATRHVTSLTPAQRMAAAATARAVVQKHLGDDVVCGAGSTVLEHTEYWFSTGSLALDHALAGQLPGGIPVGRTTGRVIHIAGKRSTGKSWLVEHVFRSVVQAGGLCLLTETEAARDPYFAEAIDLDLRQFDVQRVPSIGKMLDGFMDWHTAQRKQYPYVPMVWAIDSLDAIEPQKVYDAGGMSESRTYMRGGGKSEEFGVMFRRLAGQVCGRYPTTILALNQVRIKPGVLFGNPEYTTGGAAPGYYGSVEAHFRVGPLGTARAEFGGAQLSGATRKALGLPAQIKGRAVGRWVRVRIEKSRLSDSLLSEADFYIDFRTGFNKYAGLFQRFYTQELLQVEQNSARVAQRRPDGTIQVFANRAVWAAWIKEDPTHCHTAPYRAGGNGVVTSLAAPSTETDGEEEGE